MSNPTVILNSDDERRQCEWCDALFGRDHRYSKAYFRKQRFCSRECSGSHRSQAAKDAREPKALAFDRWVDRGDGCWLWTGARDADGYGVFNYAGKTFRAPRVALELAGRPPGRGEYACHKCDNPACVRPDHLYPGTPGQNSGDAIRRGRWQRGEMCHAAKLNPLKVRIIRGSSDTDENLAGRFGVSRSAVSMARSGKTWGHVR